MKAYYSDVDDTLIPKDGMLKEVELFLEQMSKKEDFFIPCSGRPLVSMIKTFRKYGLRYVIAYNGGQIYDLKTDKVIYNNCIYKDEASKIIEELKALQIDYITYNDNIIYTNNLNNEYAQIESKFCDEPLTLLEEVEDTTKILGLIDPQKSDEAIKKIKEKFKNVEIFKSQDFFIEITPSGVTKGKAIEKLNSLLNVKDEDTYCFGDSHNDLTMFKLNINKIAVGNAKEEIKVLADEIIGSCEQAGVAKYITSLYGETNE